VAIAEADILPDPLREGGLSRHGDATSGVSVAVAGLSKIGDNVLKAFTNRSQLAFYVRYEFPICHLFSVFFFFQ
jgi:hypothetical protein